MTVCNTRFDELLRAVLIALKPLVPAGCHVELLMAEGKAEEQRIPADDVTAQITESARVGARFPAPTSRSSTHTN
ncbi:hypothetical protein PBY51_013652 [Eleginops maclovinus]|uniref:Uncharacterized protein n=1 Tax=Eleginops maclovinus TaxID=56733 RepID=A0AAN7XZP2_ELEMC|nr:hypothetical protein PBY51_013652 [Eleginops maclovinus]